MNDYLEINPAEIRTRDLHQYLLSSVAPRPIAFASTINEYGTPNLAPFSFFNAFSARPPIVVFSPARRVRDNTTKHTLENIYRIPEVVINAVSYDMVHQQNLASSEYAEDINEFEKAGLTAVKSDLVRPYRVAESPVQMECLVREIKPLADSAGAGNLIICEVVKMHIKQSILDEAGMIDPQKIDLVSRMGKMFYSRASGSSVFTVNKPGATPGSSGKQCEHRQRMVRSSGSNARPAEPTGGENQELEQ